MNNDPAISRDSVSDAQRIGGTPSDPDQLVAARARIRVLEQALLEAIYSRSSVWKRSARTIVADRLVQAERLAARRSGWLERFAARRIDLLL